MAQVELGEILHGNNGIYQIEHEIARGGMGAIYRAMRQTDQVQVAIKEACLDPLFCEDPETRQQVQAQIQREMAVLQDLDHPNIPKVHDHFQSHNNEYMVMEYIQGCTLMQISQRAQRTNQILDESRVIGWTLQILDALQYLHTRPTVIFHRDIKPENLILTPEGRVVLVDFGLMKEAERKTKVAESFINTFGTQEYAPPEQFDEQGWGTDARSDIYSLGATIYYLLAGRLPPRAKDRVIAGLADYASEVPSIRLFNPTVSKRMNQVITKSLEFNRDQRFQTAQEMRDTILPPRRFLMLPF